MLLTYQYGKAKQRQKKVWLVKGWVRKKPWLGEAVRAVRGHHFNLHAGIQHNLNLFILNPIFTTHNPNLIFHHKIFHTYTVQQWSHPAVTNTPLKFKTFSIHLHLGPQSPPRDNVERPLPSYDDNDHEDEAVVPETQNLDDDEDLGVEEVYEMEDEDEDEDVADASDPKGKSGKMDRQTWTKKQEEALAKAWVHCSLNKEERKSTKSGRFLGKSSSTLQHDGWR
ncbi:hypothetical protein HanPI659440_Chr10g0388931 [Helianthus annuus]|nr:hypothetical protein HanPI659440_Chr10g0388931 [Helianthus annuus]